MTQPQTEATPVQPSSASSRPTSTERSAVQIRGLIKEFSTARGSVRALDGIDLDIRRGEFLTVVGPSGCGKTTLLNIVAGLVEPTAGTVDTGIAEDRPLTSVVFQEGGVFPWMTVLDNAAFGLKARGISRKERYEIARPLLSKMGLTAFEHAYPNELSGGMRQRVNLARAFANDPSILLMDEPFASLDEQTKLLLQDDLLEMWEESRKTVLFITHSLDEAVRLADRVIVMTARPGRVKGIVPVPLARPRELLDLAGSQEFAQIHGEVWEWLRAEVLQAHGRADRAGRGKA